MFLPFKEAQLQRCSSSLCEDEKENHPVAKLQQELGMANSNIIVSLRKWNEDMTRLIAAEAM